MIFMPPSFLSTPESSRPKAYRLPRKPHSSFGYSLIPTKHYKSRAPIQGCSASEQV